MDEKIKAIQERLRKELTWDKVNMVINDAKGAELQKLGFEPLQEDAAEARTEKEEE